LETPQILVALLQIICLTQIFAHKIVKSREMLLWCHPEELGAMAVMAEVVVQKKAPEFDKLG